MSDQPLPVHFDADGLVPVVIQAASSSAVLMVAFMNAEALAQTRATGRVNFWSRSRGKLWRKGETSGHEQRVREIFVNCDQNSLLITVDQVGAVCHAGYPTCYYRRLDPDNALVVVEDRWFDPADVYGTPPTSPGPVAPERATPAAAAHDDDEDFRQLTVDYLTAFARLRDEDFTAESRTSALLHDPDANIRARVADELGELAGALDGSHVHTNQPDDIALEAGQVIYWVTVASLHQGLTWEQLRPDIALLTVAPDLPVAFLPRLLRGEAAQWALVAPLDPAPAAHAALALVAQALAGAGLKPADVLRTDLNALRTRPYFASR